MLLRVPAASLADLATFGKKMRAKGYPYNAIGTRIGFDMNASYPKLTFKAMRPLTDEELQGVAEHLRGDKGPAILDTAPEAVAESAPVEEATPAVDTDFEDDAPAPAPKPKPKAEKPAPKKAAKPKAEPAAKAEAPDEVEEAESESETNAKAGDDELDSILAELEGLS